MNLLGGAELMEYSSLLQRLSMLIPVVVLTYLLGPNTLIAFGHQNHFNYSFIMPSTLYILILLIFWNMGSLNFEVIIISRILVDVMMALYRLVVAIHYRLIFISKWKICSNQDIISPTLSWGCSFFWCHSGQYPWLFFNCLKREGSFIPCWFQRFLRWRLLFWLLPEIYTDSTLYTLIFRNIILILLSVF